MNNPIFSLSAIMGADVLSNKGDSIGILEDVIWNKDSGKVTYLIVSPQEPNEAHCPVYFAIHHSFFYFDGPDELLTFNPKIGKDDHSFFLDLPTHYEDTDMQDLTGFNRYLLTYSAVATHRSDNGGLTD